MNEKTPQDPNRTHDGEEAFITFIYTSAKRKEAKKSEPKGVIASHKQNGITENSKWRDKERNKKSEKKKKKLE